jgi:hypothetical protein
MTSVKLTPNESCIIETLELGTKRGPGGHWNRYVAWWPDNPNQKGFGQTQREAIHELNKLRNP